MTDEELGMTDEEPGMTDERGRRRLCGGHVRIGGCLLFLGRGAGRCGLGL